MIRRALIAGVACIAIGAPSWAQPTAIGLPPPPIPTGAPLSGIAPPLPTGELLPPVETGPALPWWLEGQNAIPPDAIAPAHLEQPVGGPVHGPPWHPTPPPAAFAGSACNFNVYNGDDIFSPDFRSYQILAGAYASSSIGPTIHAFNYLPITFRSGWMLTAPDDNDGYLRGNWECLADVTAAPIFSKYGHCLFGPSVNLRRNFVWPGASLVPYTQVGAGFLITDAYKEDWQRAIGQAFELEAHAQIGLRYFISDNWSLDIEGGYQHISNAGMASRNAGVNALGGQLGVTYHFPAGVR